jgi:ATP-binding cassette subfamily C protein/ATP-binding cassette subfamily C protein LapB
VNALAPPDWWLGAAAAALRRAAPAPVPVPEDVAARNDLSELLGAFLAHQGWPGGPEHLAEAAPHLAGRLDLAGLRATLANLGYATRLEPARGCRLRAADLPVMLLPARQPAVLLSLDPDGRPQRVVAGRDAPEPLAVLPQPADGLLLRLARDRTARPRQGRDGFVAGVLRRFRPMLPTLLLASLMLALLSLAVPLFTQAVFDVLVGGRTAGPLPMLLAGLLAALAFEAGFRALRMRVLARIGARIDALMATGTLDQLLGLPLAMTERVGIAAQVSRVRDFSTLREFFTGSLAVAALDAPFALLLLGVLAVIAGPVALAPLAAAAGFLVLFLLAQAPMRRAVAALAVAAQDREQITAEILAAMRLLRATGATGVWAGRHAASATAAAIAGARIAMLGGTIAAVSQAITNLAALTAIAIGVHAVLAGSMTGGALIAAMMIIWRVLGPLQLVFTMLSRWEQVRTSMRQADQLMAIAPEREPGQVVRPIGQLRGEVQLSRVSLRYLPQAEPALLGVGFSVAAGQFVAITGASGSGKSTLLQLINGLHRPTAGTVKIDGFDIRRFDPVELRRAIAYAPAVPHLLYGTLAQNLLLANRAATRREMLEAAALTGLDRMVGRLPDGFETRVRDNGTARLPASLLTRLSLTRALLRPARIVLLDEPANGLDDEGSAAVLRVIGMLRGKATLFVVTHRPSHVALADRAFRLVDGELSELPRPPAPRPAAVPIRPVPVGPA